MPSDISRRLVLASGVGLLGGCLSGLPASDGSDDATTVQRTTSADSDGPRTDDLYVDNRDGESHRVSVRVEQTDTEETVLEAEYALPGLRRMRVPDIGEEGHSYEVSVTVNGERAVETWDVRTCEGTEAPKGNRDVAARIEDGEVDVVENVCDVIYVEPRPATNHAEYLVEESETTVSG